MNPNFRTFAIWVIIALLLIALFNLFQNPTSDDRISAAKFQELLKDGTIADVTIGHPRVRVEGHLRDGTDFHVYLNHDSELEKRLRDAGIEIKTNQ